jgi:hypothetical protein
MNLIDNGEKYYFAKAADLFSDLPARHQSAFIKYFADKVNVKFWLDNWHDSTQYRDVLRSILFYYSGREKAKDPNKKEFRNELMEFMRSDEFKSGVKHEAKEFKEGLESL